MIAMNMTRTSDACRRHIASAAPASDHPLRHAMMYALALFGLGVGGVAFESEDL